MASTVDLDNIVIENLADTQSFHDVEEIPSLGSSAACAYIVSQVEGKFMMLECFDRTRLNKLSTLDSLGKGFVASLDASSALKAAGLDHFVDIISEWNNVDTHPIDTFVMAYNVPKRRSLVRGQNVYINADNITSVFKIPNDGVNLSVVRTNKDYVLDGCFVDTHNPNLDPNKVGGDQAQVFNIRLEWRPWVELVQVYLHIKPMESSMDTGTLREAVAIRQGLRINWALLFARTISKSLLNFKENEGELRCASYISTLIKEVCLLAPSSVVGPSLPKPKVGLSSEHPPVPNPDPVASQRDLKEFENWVARGGSLRYTEQLQQLNLKNADLQEQLEKYKIQLEKQKQSLVASQLQVETLREELEDQTTRLEELNKCVVRVVSRKYPHNTQILQDDTKYRPRRL